MNDSTWRQRTDTLNRNGYARYDESTSRYLADTSAMLLEKYGGDLRKLREAARRDPACERELLKECKGIGDVGVDIFFREVQTAWEELFPFIDRTAVEGARQLGLPTEAGKLAKLVGRDDFPALVAALARVKLEKRYESVKQKAA
jgi:hypothetical protein